MTDNWIHAQTDRNVAQFDTAMETHYPESADYLRDPVKYYARTCVECNYLDAVKQIDWQRFLNPSSTLLDFGCGGGWLSGYLSTLPAVAKIYCLDSSRRFIRETLPEVVRVMEGDMTKLTAIEGLFAPILLDDGSLDAIVASSVLHHADRLEEMLRELRRTLKPGGYLFILNETPSSGVRHVLSVSKGFLSILMNLCLRRYRPISPAISSSGYLNNPYLGDRNYPLWYWQEAIRRAGFSLVEQVDSGLPTIKGQPGQTLHHFICKAV